MREVMLFVEDYGHEEFLKALLQRLAKETGIRINTRPRSVRGGHGRVISELRQFLRDLRRGREGFPDLLVVATDANCKGLAERIREITGVTDGSGAIVVCAVPDPHIERWLMLDSAAFKTVFGKGCPAPDKKCSRDRYKERFLKAICATDIIPSLGGVEFAADLVQVMDLVHVEQADDSLGKLIKDLRSVFHTWQM